LQLGPPSEPANCSAAAARTKMEWLAILFGLLLIAGGITAEYHISTRYRPAAGSSKQGRAADGLPSADDGAEQAEPMDLLSVLKKKYGMTEEDMALESPRLPSLLSAAGSIALLTSGTLFLLWGAMQEAAQWAPTSVAVPLIIDTDMSFDVDDVGAICIAHAMMDRGEADLLAVIHSSAYPEGIGAASVLNEWYGHDSVKLGAYKGPFGVDGGRRWIKGLYVPNLVASFPSPVKNSSQVPDGVKVYRAALASAADASVAIAVIGFATNIAPLLRSGPDEISKLSGVELVRQKVKLVVWQGGWYEPLHPDGNPTFNWDCGGCCGYLGHGCLGESSYAVAHMPEEVEQIFTDIGDEIYHGGARLRTCAPPSNPCRQAYIDHVWGLNDRSAVSGALIAEYGAPAGRQSWDPLAVLVAVRGAAAGNCTKDQPGGRNRVDYRGANYWTPPNASVAASKQSILALTGEQPWFAQRLAASKALDSLLCEPPRRRRAE